MELDRKGVPVRVVDAFAGLVVRVDVTLFAPLHGLGDDGVTVVLARDEGPGALDVPAGLVDAPVAVLELRGLRAGGDSRQLVSETDAEDRLHAEELGDLHDLVLGVRRVPGTVRQHDAVGVLVEDVIGRGRTGQDDHIATPLLEFPDDVPLGTVVEERHLEGALFPGTAFDRFIEFLLLRGHGRHRVCDDIRRDLRKIAGDGIAQNGVHDPVFPDGLRDLTCIDSVNAGNAPVLEESIQGVLATEIGRLLAPFADDIPLDETVAFEVVLDDAVVPDERVGLQHDLSIVTGVGQGLDVTAHAGREDQLPDGGHIGPERKALINGTVREDEVPLFLHVGPLPSGRGVGPVKELRHSQSISPMVAAMTALMVCIRFSASSNTRE